MSEAARIKSPAWFMVVAVVLFIWNLLGVMAYVMQVTMSPEVMAALPVMVIVIAIYLVTLAAKAKARKWTS